MTVPLDTLNDIRSMDVAGRSRSEIARMPHVSRNTVAEYADMEDMSPAAPMPQRRGRPALEGNEEWVAGVLEADLGLATLMRTVPGGALETGGARPGGRAHRQGPPARHRRARVSPARRGRGEAALPGLRRRIREAVGGNHHEPGVQQVGVGVRGRPDSRRRDRPHRPPREARPVPRRVLPRPPCPHAGGLAAQKACALPMLRLLNFRCSFCSNPLDETHQIAPHLHAATRGVHVGRARLDRSASPPGRRRRRWPRPCSR